MSTPIPKGEDPRSIWAHERTTTLGGAYVNVQDIARTRRAFTDSGEKVPSVAYAVLNHLATHIATTRKR